MSKADRGPAQLELFVSAIYLTLAKRFAIVT